jgi:hypothetical protein
VTRVPVPSVDDRVAARLRERDLYAAEVVANSSGFPTYEVPAFVAERFPAFRPEDPSTWPEPDRCTDGRPYGFDAYGQTRADRWQRYLAALDAVAASTGRPPTWTQRDLGCRNRWKHDDSRLCGTHDKPWRDSVRQAEARLRRNARELEHLDLAKQLAAHGIVADGTSDSVRLQADAVRDLLRLLGEASS